MLKPACAGDEFCLGPGLTFLVFITHFAIVIFGRILGEISEFNALEIGPEEVENQFQSDE